MKREFLEGLGITEKETIDKILDENSSDIGKAKAGNEDLQDELDKLKETNKTLTTENTTLTQAVEDTKNGQSTKDEELKSLQQELESYKTKELKTQIALEKGIPLQLANRLTGDDEESLKKDADTLAAFIKDQQPTPPLKSTEPAGVGADSNDTVYKNLLENLNLEGD